MNVLWWLLRRSNTELKIVGATLAVLFILPTVTVVVFASSGLSILSNALASLNPITHLVEIFDPDGNKVTDLQLSTVWPARGYVSDEFGTLSEERKGMGLGTHTGIDIANSFGVAGDPITPFASGTVVKVHAVDDGACGKYVLVDHGHHVASVYCHMLEPSTVEQAEVKPGDIIGYMGSSGASTGPHLHFGVYVYGIAVNPRTFMVGEPEASTHGSF
jgi:murein DD-endopeptidase MepM/ murein hydrolase activator NlpD